MCSSYLHTANLADLLYELPNTFKVSMHNRRREEKNDRKGERKWPELGEGYDSCENLVKMT